ncbi:ShlB/FhaC/HecB family hemolysin secretion/activation protein [Limnohabitans sp. Jir61]|uniref:ShlB/FhaC/HecB family hemolysin secretion/activation protein n=1 Tax=Limnohabitans sp. Jir61 TaxID=1826168 RepID=UPI001304C10A|nr:ShlB/FhaC/HecB family hemolysin secretion/activation protein [Limnohabitans sp. Jir61]
MVFVKGFNFIGNTLISSDALTQPLAAYGNRKLTFAQLKEAVDLVINTYRDAGWTVRAYLPKQEIDEGIVTIQVVEAVFGKVILPKASPDRVPTETLIRMVDAAQPAGKAMSASGIDRALLLLDDLPGIQVAGHLVEGQKHGETDLLLSVTEEPLLSGNASFDNNGSISTGTERLNLNLSVASPLRLGDALTTNFLKTQGSDYSRLAYSAPTGSEGWRTGIHTTLLNYHLLDKFAISGGYGAAKTTGLDAAYPLLRGQQQNINLALSYDDKRFDNFISSGPVSTYKLNVYNINLSVNQTDSWQGAGSSNASVGVSQGSVNLDGSANQPSDAGGPNTAGRYNKLNLNLSRIQTLTPSLNAFVGMAFQTANKNLDSSEKLYLSGVSGVRAYPSGEGGGSTGHTLTAELRQRLHNEFVLTGFYDYGHANAFKNNARADGTGDNAVVNSHALQGYGATLNWQSQNGIDLKVTWAKRIGSNPLAQPSGQDTDGTKKINRIWLNASVNF